VKFRAPSSYFTRPIVPDFGAWLRWSAPLGSWMRLMPLIGFLGLSLLVFFAVEQPIRMYQSDLRLGADSHTYYALAELLSKGGGNQFEFIGLGANFLGPIAMVLALKTPFWIMVCNSALFLLALWACTPVKGLSKTTLALLLALNATTLVSLVTLNKEIFALTASLLLCRYVYTGSRSKILLAIILLIGFLARWEQPAITLLFLFFRREGSFFRRHPRFDLLLLIAVLTVGYTLALHSSAVDLSAFTDQAMGGNAILALDRLQGSFGFPLVLLPKAIMSISGRLFMPGYWFTDYLNEDFTDLANQYVVHLHCVAMLALLLAAFLKGRLKLDRPLPFVIALYLIITAANPFIQPRYEYPVYVWLCFDLARREWTTPPFHLRIHLKRPFRRIAPAYFAEEG
jgi:hypothetical protein